MQPPFEVFSADSVVRFVASLSQDPHFLASRVLFSYLHLDTYPYREVLWIFFSFSAARNHIFWGSRGPSFPQTHGNRWGTLPPTFSRWFLGGNGAASNLKLYDSRPRILSKRSK